MKIKCKNKWISHQITLSFTVIPPGDPLLSHMLDGCFGHVSLSELCMFAHHCICPNDFSVKPWLSPDGYSQ